ncbi:MAG: septum formation initiator family protein [Gammaproteobacteria bacterium]|nr:septum formation initiator family protein [Gammaproteobacteria bacterium]
MIIVILLILLVIMQFQFWQQRASVHEITEILAAQRQDNEQIRASNEALAAEVEDLRQGMQAVEERARSQLGLIADGEQFIQLIPAQPEAQRSDPDED